MRAFKYFTNLELVNMLLVFKIPSCPTLINNAERLLNFSSSVIGKSTTSFYLGNTVGRVFSAGETIPELEYTLKKLSQMNQGSIIGYVAEGEKSEEGMNFIAEEIEESIKIL